MWNLGAETVDEDRAFGPRAHECHIAPKYVPKLRKLIQARTTQERPDSRAPLVARLRPDGTGLPFGIDVHRAELPHPETPAVETHAFLRVKYRPRGRELDHTAYQQEQRREQHEGERGRNDVRHPLRHGAPADDWRVVD